MQLEIELQLVKKAKTDVSAFGELYDYYLPKIFAYVRSRVVVVEVAEDITSQVFLSAVKGIKKFDDSKNVRFGSWLYRVANNKVIDHYRKKKFVFNQELIDRLESDEVPQTEIENLHRQSQIAAVLGKIKPRYQEIITYRFYSEMEISEISEAMDTKPSNVSVLLHRALAAFKKEFEKKYPKIEIFDIT